MKFGLIMAGGLGKRMGSLLPKVLHEINCKPMIYYVIEKAFEIGCTQIGIIVGKYHEQIKLKIDEYYLNDSRIVYIEQKEPLGTGHAVKCALNWMNLHLNVNTDVLILSGDVPLISVNTLQNLLQKDNSILITKTDKPDGCGRIIFNLNNNVEKIIEEKDCTIDQKNIKYINCGIYNMKLRLLLETINKITNENMAQEYYLTDMIEIASKLDYKIETYELPKERLIEVANINTLADLEFVKQNI
jgi:UDP-N-acetylglucosamine diphosphorylase/glucosamine-1-phosphate N-acetyltransferase